MKLLIKVPNPEDADRLVCNERCPGVFCAPRTGFYLCRIFSRRLEEDPNSNGLLRCTRCHAAEDRAQAVHFAGRGKPAPDPDPWS